MEYTAHCGYCNTMKTGINDFFCIKNRDCCECCFTKKRYLLRKIRRSKNTDPFIIARAKRRPDETVDKKPKKLA